MSDLISRQALRKAMYHEAMEKDSDEQRWDGGCWVRYKMFERVIDSLPSAEPVLKHGEWICDRLVNTNGGTYGVRRCSICEAYYQDVGYGWNYCPHCGARMDTREPQQ